MSPYKGEVDTTWVSAGRVRNFLLGDPLLDWLELYGEDSGFVPDTKLPSFDPRTDFTEFIFAKGHGFEAAVIAYLSKRLEIETVVKDYREIPSPAKATETLECMQRGVPVIYQGVLHRQRAMKIYHHILAPA